MRSLLALSLMTGANYADYHTTRQAFSRCPACVEANPLIGQHGERLIAVKVASVAAEQFAFEKLHKHHKKAAWFFVAGVVGANLAIAYHNQKVGR